MKNLTALFFVFSLYIQVSGDSTESNYHEIGTPLIRNYSFQEYRAHPQNWAIAQDARGIMYFGNLDGIMIFDGSNWQLMETHSVVRSLAADANGTIYAGLIDDFGYLAVNNTGKIIYISLNRHIPKKDLCFGDVWRIVANAEGVYFFTNQRIFHWHQNNMMVFPLQGAMYWGFTAYNELFAIDKNKGIMVLKNNQFISLPGTEAIHAEKSVEIVIIPFQDNKLLIALGNGTLYLYHLDCLYDHKSRSYDFLKKPESKILEIFSNDISSLVKTNQYGLFDAVQVNQHGYAFATIKGGIVLMDGLGKLIRIINSKNGLQNNTVWNLFLDKNKNLWAALNIGISHIEINSPITCFTEQHGLQGNYVTAIVRHQDIIYAATFSGVFYLPLKQKNQINNHVFFLPVSHVEENCWDFCQTENILFAGGRSGLFAIRGAQGHLVLKTDLIYCLGQSDKFPNTVFIGSNSGFAAVFFKPENKQTAIKSDHIFVFKEIPFAIRKIIADTQGNLWLTAQTHGVIHLQFNGNTIDNYEIRQYGREEGLPSLEFNRVFFVDRQLLVGTVNQGIYKVVKNNNQNNRQLPSCFEPEKKFGNWFDNQGIFFMQMQKDKSILVGTDSHLGLLQKNTSGLYFWNSIPFKRIPKKSETYYLDSHQTIWCGGAHGLFRFDQKREKNYNANFNTLIRKVSIHNHSILFHGNYFQESSSKGTHFSIYSLDQPSCLSVVLPYQKNSIYFEYAAVFFESTPSNQFSNYLQPFDKNWSNWTFDTKAAYTNLPEGGYTFLVKSRNIFETIGTTAAFHFTVLPPWYRTLTAYIVYGVVFILMIGISLLIHFRIVRHALLTERKKYQKSLLPLEITEFFLKKLLDYINNEKPYLDSNFRMATISAKLGISSSYLSQILNLKLNQNFYDFVNHYRIKEAIDILSDPNHKQDNILDIAFKVGFNSKQTFNSAFKKYTHMTPSQFKKNQKNSG